jgi:hypothetical protein
MLNLLQWEYDDVEAAVERWLDSRMDENPIVRRQRFREAVDRIYEVCQTAHARELRAVTDKVVTP